MHYLNDEQCLNGDEASKIGCMRRTATKMHISTILDIEIVHMISSVTVFWVSGPWVTSTLEK